MPALLSMYWPEIHDTTAPAASEAGECMLHVFPGSEGTLRRCYKPTKYLTKRVKIYLFVKIACYYHSFLNSLLILHQNRKEYSNNAVSCLHFLCNFLAHLFKCHRPNIWEDPSCPLLATTPVPWPLPTAFSKCIFGEGRWYHYLKLLMYLVRRKGSYALYC